MIENKSRRNNRKWKAGRNVGRCKGKNTKNKDMNLNRNKCLSMNRNMSMSVYNECITSNNNTKRN